jgi:hypothetical protein
MAKYKAPGLKASSRSSGKLWQSFRLKPLVLRSENILFWLGLKTFSFCRGFIRNYILVLEANLKNGKNEKISISA